MASDFLPFGVLGRPHGMEGEILLQPYDGARARPAEWRLPPRLSVAGPDGEIEMIVVSARGMRDGYLVRFEGIGDRDAAALLTGRRVGLPRQSLPPLAAAEFFVEEITGCEVYRDGEQQRLGKVVGTYWNGAQDIMVIAAQDGGEHLLPVLPEYVLRFDRERRRLVVDPHD
jgi:16S rRNA processing protein RimM